MKRALKTYLIICLLFLSVPVAAQNISVESLKGLLKAKPVKISGGINASSVFFNGNGSTTRDPFTYFLQGSVNINLLGQINLPLSFSLTNSGAGYGYPLLPSRLSLHPSYEWVTAHIGDVAMSFSPYTLNGIQFRGLGVDLTPDGPWKISAMYGLLQRAVTYDAGNPWVLPSYERMGQGAKVGYEQKEYSVGLTVFHASDDVNSLVEKPDSLLIYPQKNLVLSWEGKVWPVAGLELSAEVATSELTNGATASYLAYKTQLNYSYQKSVVGVGYERVAPGYQTLGAYYFNNDLENITINLSQSFLKDKASIAINTGFQHDNLDHSKASGSRRFVGSVNLGYQPSEKVQATFNYSSFQTYTNIRPQFETINQALPYQNMDTLNYVQISKNAGFNINWVTSKNEKQRQALNVNLSFQGSSDQQGGIVDNGNASQFYNVATAYNVLLVKQGVGITLACNASYNTIGRNDFLTVGPTLAVNAKLFKKSVTTGFSSSYNISNAQGLRQSSVLNMRANASYVVMKKHNLNFNVINQSRQVMATGASRDLTATLGYGYNFK